MTTVTDLLDDLVREIFSRVPLTSLSAVRSTCKKWNAISKDIIVGKKVEAKNQFLEFMIIDSRVCSLRLDLQGIRSEEDLIDLSMKQISIPNNNDQVEISQVYHCDGLLLCIVKDSSSLMVWNPYLGQTKWIQARNKFHEFDRFALGYDNNRNHKILRFLYNDDRNKGGPRKDIDVYDFSYDSWRVLDVNYPYLDKLLCHNGVSLKGNTYFFGREVTYTENYLLCFDFTIERFGPRLPLPFKPPSYIFNLTLSWVRDEKLAVLYNHYDTLETIEIWISTKIEPNAVSWKTFLTIDTTLINGLPNHFPIYFYATSFFIDEEKKVAVIFDFIDTYRRTETGRYHRACIVGDSGYFKSVNIGLVSNSQQKPCKLVSSSYVPSLVQLQD
ncbi:unnamed protein product [Arabidopsis halleri]